MKNPLVAPLLAVVAGIMAAQAVAFGWGELLAAVGALAAIAIYARRVNARLAFTATLVALVLVGALDAVWHLPGNAPTADAGAKETVLLAGCVTEPSIFNQDRDQFTLELAQGAAARVSLAVREGETPPLLAYGEQIEIAARLRPIRNFQNPGAFDFAGYSARRQIYWTAAASHGTEIRRLPGRCGSRFWAAIYGLRSAALGRLDHLYANDAYQDGMLQAILIGETTKLEKVWTEHFRRTGTFHALVISGLHVSVLAGFLLFLLRLCFVPELAGLVATAFAAWTYALVSGWSAPVVRAAGGFTLYLVGRFFFRRGRVLNLLAAVALGYLIYDPGQLFEASFQLSFLSVAALATLAMPILERTSAPYARGLADIGEVRRDTRLEPQVAQLRVELRLLAETLALWTRASEAWVAKSLEWVARLSLYIYETVVLSTTIQIGLALPMALYFHRLSFTGFSANVLIVPLLTLAVPVGFVAIFSNWSIPARMTALLVSVSEKIADFHARFEPAWRVADPPLWLCLAFTAALAWVALAMGRKTRWRWPAWVTVLSLFGLICWHPFRPRVVAGQMELTAVDVGQGDGLLLAYPNGTIMLVDGGGIPAFGRKLKPRLDIGEDVMSPYLWTRQITRVDVIACTHAHEDHVGGVPALIDNFHPRELWTGANTDNEIWRNIEQHARAAGTKIVSLRAGNNFDYGGARVEVLSPPEDYEPARAPKNNDSLVMRIGYGSRHFVLTGDMEKEMEARLLEDERVLSADVLKVGHHGSKTSSTEPFLSAVSPTFALISDGFENNFGHPHKSVLERLAEHRVGVLRTDQQGLVTIRTDGNRLWLETARYLR